MVEGKKKQQRRTFPCDLGTHGIAEELHTLQIRNTAMNASERGDVAYLEAHQPITSIQLKQTPTFFLMPSQNSAGPPSGQAVEDQSAPSTVNTNKQQP